ncbi:cyclic AMP-responsive element-binding protein 3-like protein 4 isoform X1 [Pleurodeles waltl]|uniref:cyclic AMP-responsive element-binding protein 3-like protein 4 isoform X1 n=1 Tax=Pleurodeles waltl TaxID=8319 RepID=UPI003709B5CC
MEHENEELLGVFFGQQDELFSSSMFPDAESGTFPLSEHVYQAAAEKLFEEWSIHENRALKDRDEPDDFLQLMINPNDVYSSGTPMASPESDSGISDDHRPDSPQHSETSQPEQALAAPYEVVFDIGTLGTIKREAVHSDGIISIQLDDWNTPILVPEPRMVHELPAHPVTSVPKPVQLPLIMTAAELQAVEALYPELMLTDEEKRLLSQEGVALPNNLPLTKEDEGPRSSKRERLQLAEERILKKVRRKIRNKQSAQDSRRRKKEYIDGLESRVAACSAQNQELHKKVIELEKHNVSLLTQLRRLQSLIKQTSTKAAQTSTCILIFIFSLALLIFPSYSPFRSGTALSKNGYKPTGVISRNILNEAEALEPIEISAKEDAVPGLSPLEETREEKPWEPLQPLAPEDVIVNVVAQRHSQPPPDLIGLMKAKNASLPNQTEGLDQVGQKATERPEKESQRASEQQKDTDLAKPIHADEM